MHSSRAKLNLVDNAEHGIIFKGLRAACRSDWEEYTEHLFVRQIADGTMPAECFRHYLVQLYLFSKNYSRAYALAVVKSDYLDDLREAAAHVDLQLNYEMELHVAYCAEWGISKEELENWPEEDANRLYTRYVLDQGLTGDLLDLLVALSPCSLGYAEIGRRLLADPKTKLSGNPYRDWIELHGGSEFQDGANDMMRYVDRVARRRGVLCHDASSERWRSLVKNFRTATQLEVRFWQMGLSPPSALGEYQPDGSVDV